MELGSDGCKRDVRALIRSVLLTLVGPTELSTIIVWLDLLQFAQSQRLHLTIQTYFGNNIRSMEFISVKKYMKDDTSISIYTNITSREKSLVGASLLNL